MGHGQIIGYRRVSSISQSMARQELPDCDVYFDEVISGKSKKRPKLEEMMRHARTGDVVQVHSIDRLARSLLDLQAIVDELVEKGVAVKFVKEGLEFSNKKDNATGRLMLQMLGSIAEFERTLILSRQREGIAKARSEGKYRGRRQTIDAARIIERWEEDRDLPLKNIAKASHCSVTTVHRALSKHEPYQSYKQNLTPKQRADLKMGATPGNGYYKEPKFKSSLTSKNGSEAGKEGE